MKPESYDHHNPDEKKHIVDIQQGMIEAAKNNTPAHDLPSLNDYFRRVQRAQEAARIPVEQLFTADDKMDLVWLQSDVNATNIVEQIDWARQNRS